MERLDFIPKTAFALTMVVFTERARWSVSPSLLVSGHIITGYL